jgi:branched-chain amino acid aminotransferase
MPECIIQRLTPQGLQPVDYRAASLAEAARYEPDEGVYTVTNTYHTTQALKFDAHLDRLEDSARRAGIPLQLDRAALRAALRQLITGAGWGNVRFRVTVPCQQPENLILSLEPFTPLTPDTYERGVRCVTLPGSARRDPGTKSTGWMHRRGEITLPAGIHEGLLVSDTGDILEGTGSNFYAVLRGELRTAGAGMLPGIAQQIVFAVAPPVLPVRHEAVNIKDRSRIEEAFLTSSSRGILPVVELDGRAIGDGTPGAFTRRLRAAYLDWVAAHLEEL